MLTDTELNQMAADAAARSDKSADHVERLVEEVKALHKQIAKLTAERDAAY